MVGEAHPESVLTVRLPRKKEGDAVLFYDYPAVERPWQNYVAEQQYGFGELTEEKGEAAQAFLTRLQEDPSLYGRFLNLPARLQKELVDFYTGQKGVKITYDPFFKYVFNPELHPERLERLLSGLLKEKVKIRQVLPTDSIRLDESMSLVVMDILVELASGALCNVETYGIYGRRNNQLYLSYNHSVHTFSNSGVWCLCNYPSYRIEIKVNGYAL